MATDYMYDLAYKFKNSKIWKTVYEQDLFAVKLPDGQIGYCQIMGIGGDHIAVALYIGEKGYHSYRKLLEIAEANPYASSDEMLVQDCIQCSLENKEFLYDWEIAEVRAYTKKHGINLRGPNSFPHFVRFFPYCVPWPMAEDNDIAAITRVMEAVSFMIDKLQIGRKQDLWNTAKRTLPLFTKEGDSFTLSKTAIPAASKDAPYPEPQHINDLLIGKLKRYKQGGTLQCELIRSPEPVQIDPDQVPFLAPIFLTLDTDTGTMFKSVLLNHAEIDPEELLDRVIKLLLENKCYPSEIEVQSEQTAAILREFCKRAMIDLIVCDELEQMNQAIDYMRESIAQDKPSFDLAVVKMLLELAELPEEEFAALPDVLKDHLLEMKKLGMLPDQLAERLK